LRNIVDAKRGMKRVLSLLPAHGGEG
jgi:hypothetical protein